MKPLSLNKKSAFWILGICALALAAAGGFWWTRPPNALERATKIITVPEWRGTNRSHVESYFWLPNGDMLILKPDGKGADHLFRSFAGDPLLEMHPEPLVQALADSEQIFNFSQLSPDGKWAIVYLVKDKFYVLTAYQMTGKTVRRYSFRYEVPPPGYSEPFWSNDGKELLYIDWGARKLHRLRPDIDVHETLPIVSLPSSLPNREDLTVITTSNTGRLIVQKEHTPPATGKTSFNELPFLLELYEVGYGADKTCNKTYSISLLQNQNERIVPLLTLSPKGDRLFLGVASWRRSPFLAWLHDRISRIPEGNYCVEQGWVMNLDGSGKHLIGEFTVPMEVGKERPWIVDPKWTPDGKKISFLYDDGIYTIPAD